METVSGHPSIHADAQALLVAVGVAPSLEGARPALSVIRTCIKAAAAKWPDAPLNEWLRVADDLASSLRTIATSDQKWAVRLSNQPLEISQLFKTFLGWGPSASEGVEFGFTAIIGRSIAVGAEQRSALQAQLWMCQRWLSASSDVHLVGQRHASVHLNPGRGLWVFARPSFRQGDVL